MNADQNIRILIADDHPVFRKGFSLILQNFQGMRLVGEAADGDELISLAKLRHPDIVVTDLKMPGKDGISATAEITKALPHTGVLVLSMIEREDYIAAVIKAGARGYLLKDAEVNEIFSAIKTVHSGGTYYSNNIIPKLAKIISVGGQRPALTGRELEVMKLLCEERSSKQIAGELNLSKRTVDWYKEQILNKLDVKSSAGIIAYAMKHNICGDAQTLL